MKCWWLVQCEESKRAQLGGVIANLTVSWGHSTELEWESFTKQKLKLGILNVCNTAVVLPSKQIRFLCINHADFVHLPWYVLKFHVLDASALVSGRGVPTVKIPLTSDLVSAPSQPVHCSALAWVLFSSLCPLFICSCPLPSHAALEVPWAAGSGECLIVVGLGRRKMFAVCRNMTCVAILSL